MKNQTIRKTERKVICLECREPVSSTLCGICPSCVKEGMGLDNPCKLAKGGRRCETHYNLPIYPKRNMCREGINSHGL